MKQALGTSSVSRRLATETLRTCFNFLGFSGLAFIVYGIVAAASGVVWAPLERLVNPLSTLLTLVGAILTAASIYVERPEPHPPEAFSWYVSAPLTIGGAIAGMVWVLSRGSIPQVIANGFALLAIAGNLFRVQQNPARNR